MPMPVTGKKDKIGLIAGNGTFPLHFARGARKRGVRVTAVALIGEATERIEEEADVTVWAGIAQIGKWIKVFKKEGVSRIAMCGGVTKGKMFDKYARLSALPDMRSVRIWYSKLKSRKDHSVLEAVAEELAAEGLELVSSVLYCPEILARETCYTSRTPSRKELEDVEFAWPIAKEVAHLQIGQTIVVKDKTVVAVEGIEGTDETLRRGGRLAKGGVRAIKVAKSNHDERFDIPAIGIGTIKILREAGVSMLAVEAGKTLVLDEGKMVRDADKAGICIVGRT